MRPLTWYAWPVLAGLALLPAQATANDRLMLILDGSGSMWGEVGGEAKIATVRRIIGDMIDELRPDQHVGLMVYGHREKGNCEDIEPPVSVSPLNKPQLKAAIEAIAPKGKTPIADAVTLAADLLRYTEEKATVVVISDGKESCGKDVCATAERLESTGVEFTAHAISLDIGDEEGKAQLRCLAEYTGGKFLVVENPPAELAEAVQEIREEIVPEAAPSGTRLVARVDSGDVVDEPVKWTIINQESEEVILAESESGTLEQELDDGRYEIYVRTENLTGETDAEVAAGAEDEIVVLLAPSQAGTALAAPDSVAAGEPMEFSWRGPSAAGDLIFIASKDISDNSYPTDDRYRHRAVDGSPARLVAPAEPGTFEVRYYSFANGTVLARSPLEVHPPEVTLKPPETVLVGEEAEITWSGPAAPGDLLFFAPLDWSADTYPLDRRYRHAVEHGTPTKLLVPDKPGTYELRYYSWANGTALARARLEVRLPEASVSVAPHAPAGSVVEARFQGQISKDDLLFIAPIDQPPSTYPLSNNASYRAVDGSPAKLVLPPEPGSYEVRYFNKSRGGLLARAPIEVTEPKVSLEAPRVVQPGTEMEVVVRGPNAPGDIVFIAPRDWKDNEYPIPRTHKHAVADGERAHFTAPAEAGTYELRYFSWSHGRKLASRVLVVR